MPIEKWSDDVAVVHLADDPQLTDDLQSLESAIGHGRLSAVLEFGGVQRLNSSNLAKLLKIRKLILGGNGRMILCSISTRVWGALLVTGLDKIFDVADDVPTALASLQMKR